jgi:hypothetical protein
MNFSLDAEILNRWASNRQYLDVCYFIHVEQKEAAGL